jgi:hypothetical protein
MKRPLLIIVLSCLFYLTKAQVPEFNFDVPTQGLCYDSVTTLLGWENWTAYHTLDNTWYGPLDSSYCISTRMEDDLLIRLQMEELDISRPVYLKWSAPDSLVLNHNALYLFQTYSDLLYTALGQNNFCEEDNFCNGVFAEIQIPSNPLDTTNTPIIRRYFEEFLYDEYGCDYNFSFCFPTEYFENGNILRSILFKYDFSANVSDQDFFISNLAITDLEGCTNILTQETMPEFYNDLNEYMLLPTISDCMAISDFCFFIKPGYALWMGEGIPSDTNRHYIDLFPIPNSTQQEDIQLIIPYDNNLTLQPFTYFRGGLIEGSDSVRHNLTIINEGMMCLNQFIDVVIGPEYKYIHNPGASVHFQSGRACMQVSGGGEMILRENAKFLYGDNGNGILAVYGNSKIILEEGSELILNNKLLIEDHDSLDYRTTVDVYMNKASRLYFGNQFRLVNFSRDENVKVIIHLNGGVLDFSGLSDEERRHFEVRYPEETQELAVIAVYGNPVDESLDFAFHSRTSGKTELRIYSMDGKLMKDLNYLATAGFNNVNYNTGSLPNGQYTLNISNGRVQTSFQFLKQ